MKEEAKEEERAEASYEIENEEEEEEERAHGQGTENIRHTANRFLPPPCLTPPAKPGGRNEREEVYSSSSKWAENERRKAGVVMFFGQWQPRSQTEPPLSRHRDTLEQPRSLYGATSPGRTTKGAVA
ncbi:hypothetical protein E2C01_004399 [Portunus trituberculatus]|uniref:Uncharacterized protein n=1 Tax=Portunus trituberculatus TaxID=210409 RepID=A0A5B7CTY8_PORTR|nr:hypothetical protein [Portunus trituberculatus]